MRFNPLLNQDNFRNLITIANIESGILKNNHVRSLKDFLEFDCDTQGIPLLVPVDKKILEYGDEDVFEIKSEVLLQKIFEIDDPNYIGHQISFQGNQKFVSSFKVKPQFQDDLNALIQQNIHTKQSVTNLKNKYGQVGAFQTRNLPHLGHEKIIQSLIDICGHVTLNPVLGPKKVGDVKLEILEQVFKNVLEKKYKDKISYHPIYSNMYYAGPIEAIHHSILRRELGFTHFIVGRDHAGAENAYHPDFAPSRVEAVKDKLGIHVTCHQGAAYCTHCGDIILKGKCQHEHEDMIDISGSMFRKCIEEKRYYTHACVDIQDFLFKLDEKVFVK